MSMETRNRRLGPWDSLKEIISHIDELENTNVKCTWFESVASGLSGTITPPAGGTIVLNEWAAGVDVLVSKIDSGVPTFEPVLDTEGVIVTGTLDAAGAWTISGTPGDGFPIALIYIYIVALSAFNYAYCLNTAQVEGVNTLALLGGLANELTGFPEDYKADSTISFVDGTRTFTITPVGDHYSVWVLGKEFIYTTLETQIITDVEGIHWIYYDSAGAIQVVANPTESQEENVIKRNALIAYILWDATNNVSTIFADERHELTMDGATHFYLHETKGYAYYEGLQAGDITADGTGATDVDATMSLTDGTLFDEDLKYETSGSGQTLSTPAQIPVYYLEGVSGTWRKDTADSFPVKNFVGGSSLLAYNSFSSPNYGQTEITNNQFVLAHIFATNDINEPIIAIQGQADYATLTGARLGSETELKSLNLIGLPAQEYVALYTLIYQTKTTYANTPQAIIRTTDLGYDFVDWRNVIISGGGGISGSGDVVGPGAATDNAIALFDGATGKVIKNSTLLSTATGMSISDGAAVAATIGFTTDDLYITNNDPDGHVIITAEKTGTGQSTILNGDPDGSAKLYYNNVLTFETITKGIKVSGYVEIEKLPADDTGSGMAFTADVDTNTVGIGGILLLGADGSYDDADASAEATAGGMVVMATAAGTGNVILLQKGTFQDAGTWAWTPGATLYLSETAGQLTETPPVTSGAIVRIMGYALTADSVFFDPDKTFIEV